MFRRLASRVADRRRDDDSGVTALELAVLAPSLLLLIFLVIQLALFLYGRSVALQTAREGVTELRLAQTYQQFGDQYDGAMTDMRQFANNVGSGMLTSPNPKALYEGKGPQGSADAADTPDGTVGTVTVTVTGSTISLVPGLDLHVTEQASGRIERFINPPKTGKVGE